MAVDSDVEFLSNLINLIEFDTAEIEARFDRSSMSESAVPARHGSVHFDVTLVSLPATLFWPPVEMQNYGIWGYVNVYLFIYITKGKLARIQYFVMKV